jgi:hypothetical protein
MRQQQQVQEGVQEEHHPLPPVPRCQQPSSRGSKRPPRATENPGCS